MPRNSVLVGSSIVYCQEFISGACTAIDRGGCPAGQQGKCSLLVRGDSFSAACAAVVMLVAQHIARSGWEDDAIGAIVEDVARMDSRYPNAPDLVREELTGTVEEYFEDFKPPIAAAEACPMRTRTNHDERYECSGYDSQRPDCFNCESAPAGTWYGSDVDNDCEHCAYKPFSESNPHCTDCWYRPDDVSPM